jgi:hypothetical protein
MGPEMPLSIGCAFAALCPDCPTSREVGDVALASLWPNVALLSLPLVVVALIAIGLHRVL